MQAFFYEAQVVATHMLAFCSFLFIFFNVDKNNKNHKNLLKALQQARTDRIYERVSWSGITTGFSCASKKYMRNRAVAWDGIYGRLHMAAPMLQLWILISAFCKMFFEIDCLSAHQEIFHLSFLFSKTLFL